MKKIFQFIASLSIAVFLTGCLVPEKFSASVAMKSDGSYTYKYDGIAIHILAAEAIRKQGSLSAKDETALKLEAEKASKDKGVRKIGYLGSGKYDLSIEREMQIGPHSGIMNVISVTKSKDGIITIAPVDLKSNDRNRLKQLNINVNGTAEVRLPSNAKVISHNATGTPGLLSKAYTWKIGAIDQQPNIKFTLSQ